MKNKEEIKEEVTEEPKKDEVVVKVDSNRKDINKFDRDAWKPKTTLGKRVKSGEIKSIDEVLGSGAKILEAEIVDFLIPNLEVDLISVGQSKGKFGGGKRSIWRQTQKKTREGNKPRFAALAVVGNKNGVIGVGFGKGKETVPAREKAIRRAKLNVIKIRMGCGSWECSCGGQHTIPCMVEGKEAGARVRLKPAPKGTGLITEKECRRILNLAGLKDVYSKALGNNKTKLNVIYACFDALKRLVRIKELK